MSAGTPIEIVARINGEAVTIPLSDVLCVRLGSADEQVRILPGVVARCLALGASALMSDSEQAPQDAARACRVPAITVDQELFGSA